LPFGTAAVGGGGSEGSGRMAKRGERKRERRAGMMDNGGFLE